MTGKSLFYFALSGSIHIRKQEKKLCMFLINYRYKNIVIFSSNFTNF